MEEREIKVENWVGKEKRGRGEKRELVGRSKSEERDG